MSGSDVTTQNDGKIKASLREHNRQVDHACRSALGVGVMVWRALDQIVSIGALVLAGFAIANGADPILASVIAAVIISGPKMLEWWLVREDYVAYEKHREERDTNK